MTETRPSLVYGLTPFHDGSLAVIEENRAILLADEFDAVKACTTWGEVRAVIPTLTETGTFAFRDDGPDRPADDEPFRWDTCQAFRDGRWPQRPTDQLHMISAHDEGLFDDLTKHLDWALDPVGDHGWGIRIDPDDADALVAMLKARGYTVRRDDDLFDRLSWTVYGIR